MANDFSGDSRCKALWRFESGALPTDSKGTNTLTPVNTPTANTSDYKEGAASTALVYASHQFYKIADAALDAGFPLKSGDTSKKATFCFFIKPASYASNGTPQTIIGYPGYDWGAGTIKFFAALANSNELILYWGYSAGHSFYTYNTGIFLDPGAWWHIAIRIDGINKVFNVRAWKYSDSTQKTWSYTPAIAMDIEASEFRIGGTIQSDTAYSFDGLMDEFVVFNDLLSDTEIDAIRAGTYAAASTRNLTTTCATVSAVSAPLVTVTRPLTTLVAAVSTIPDFALWKNSTTPYSYNIPNTPANDPTCVARWRFESFDNIDDLIGGNQLLWRPADGHPLNFNIHKEGGDSEFLDSGVPNYMMRADSDLSANFPFKSSQSQVGNISGWFYTLNASKWLQVLWSKWSDALNLKSFRIELQQGVLQVDWGVGGSTGETWLIQGLNANQWYHLSVNFDGPNKAMGIRLWDDSAQAAYFFQHTFSNAMGGGAADFQIGSSGQYLSCDGNYFDGYVDETIVWNRKLTIAEMELVQEQYFHGDINVESNNFLSDPSCQAVWDFEESAPDADLSGNGNSIVTDNLFASNGLLGAGTAGKLGNGYGQITGAYIPDAQLANGFPFKSNDIAKKATICAWITPYGSLYGGTIFSKKGGSDNNGFEIIQDSNSPYNLKIVWGDGSSSTTYDTGIALKNKNTYHISVEIDAINKSIYAEIFDNIAGVLYTYAVIPFTQATVSTHPLGIGNNGDGGNNSWNGFIDQVVVWKRLLSPAELAAVRVGTFICRALGTTVAAQTQTSTISITFFIALTSSIYGVSITGAPVLAVKRPLTSSLPIVSAVPTPDLSIQRTLALLAEVMSATSDINLGRFGLTFTNVAVRSQVQSVDLAVSRLLNNSIAVQSQALDVTLKVLRDLATVISSQSTSSTPVLDLFDFLTTVAQITTGTSGSLDVLRLLVTSIATQAIVPNISLSQHAIWDLITTIAIQASTPDIELILTFYESLLAKAKRFYRPINADTLKLDASQWIIEEEQKELHLPGDQYNDHEI